MITKNKKFIKEKKMSLNFDSNKISNYLLTMK